MHPAIRKGDPEKHPGKNLFASYYEAKQENESEWATGADRMVIRDALSEPNTPPPFVWDRALTTPEMASIAWERVRAEMPKADSGDKARAAIWYMQEMVNDSKKAATMPTQSATNGVGQSIDSRMPSAYASGGQFMAGTPTSQRPMPRPAFLNVPSRAPSPPPPPPLLIPPPQIRVQFYLQSGDTPIYLYHDVLREGAWLRLILDERTPGVDQFSDLDTLDDIITVVVDGHQVAYGCRATANRMRYDNRIISNLLIDHEIPLER